MKGDLHTLKKVCQYGSKVMLGGTAVILAVLAAYLVLGAASFFSDGMASFLQDCIGIRFEGHTAVQVAAAYLSIVAVLAMAVVTVFVTYLVMTSIVTEHSPFNETNTGRVLRLSQIYLIAAVAMGILGLLGPHGILFAAFVFFGCILVSVILYSLALIVRYGSVLQNESDHTL